MPSDQPAHPLVRAVEQVPPGVALDLACGSGRHAIFLAASGWQVTAVDSSPAAIASVRDRAGDFDIDARVVDLETADFEIGRASFDLIIAWLYLQRNLFPKIRDGVRPGGLAACAVLLQGRFAARPGELRAVFDGWDILHDVETGQLAEIVARK